jgi:hypothetical protein
MSPPLRPCEPPAAVPDRVPVIDFATRRVEVTWPIPGGGSPDMGNVRSYGRLLWLSARDLRVLP